MAPNVRTRPSVIQLAVGRDPALGASAGTQDQIFEFDDALGSVQIEIQNHSKTQNLVFALQLGTTNLEAGYATKQIRVDGSLVNSVTVPPLATVTAVVDGPNAPATPAKNYWRFRVTNQLVAFGTITVTHQRGELIPRKLFPTP